MSPRQSSRNGETTPFLQVRDLSVSLDTPGGEVRAVRHISFAVNAGETAALRQIRGNRIAMICE
ncbi:MAG: hypothetical protein AB7P69_21385 [Candidatus Binatia bacterium]